MNSSKTQIALLAMCLGMSHSVFAADPIDMKYCTAYIKADSDLADLLPLDENGRLNRSTLKKGVEVTEKDGLTTISFSKPTGIDTSERKTVAIKYKNGSFQEITLEIQHYSFSTPMPLTTGHPYGPMTSGMGFSSNSLRSWQKKEFSFETLNGHCVPTLETYQFSTLQQGVYMPPGVRGHHEGQKSVVMGTEKCHRIQAAQAEGLTAENINTSLIAYDFPEKYSKSKEAQKYSFEERVRFANITLQACKQRVGVGDALSNPRVWALGAAAGAFTDPADAEK